MKLEITEKRMIVFCLNKVLREYTEKLSTLNEDSDKYMELGNDAMLIKTIVSKLQE